jgi:hypothetical protein
MHLYYYFVACLEAPDEDSGAREVDPRAIAHGENH